MVQNLRHRMLPRLHLRRHVPLPRPLNNFPSRSPKTHKKQLESQSITQSSLNPPSMIQNKQSPTPTHLIPQLPHPLPIARQRALIPIIHHRTQRPHLQRPVVPVLLDDVQVRVIHAVAEGGTDVGDEGAEALGEGVVEGREGGL